MYMCVCVRACFLLVSRSHNIFTMTTIGTIMYKHRCTNRRIHTHTPSPCRRPMSPRCSSAHQARCANVMDAMDKPSVLTSWTKQRQNTKRQVQDHCAVQNVKCTPLYTPAVPAVADNTDEIDSAATQPKLRRMNASSDLSEYLAECSQSVESQCGNEAGAADSPDSTEHIWQAPLPDSAGSSNDDTSGESDVNTQDACCIQKDCGATNATNAIASTPSPPKLLKRSYAQICDEPELSAEERNEFERNLRELRAEIKRLDCHPAPRR